MDEILNQIKKWLKNTATDEIVFDSYYCKTRNLFQSKVNRLLEETQDSLLDAVVGEIGNNAYDHNLGNWKDIVGLVFIHNPKERVIIIADRGQGLRETLSKVKDGVDTDEQAIKIAFTEIISGRSPEQRGNGLKFVLNIVKMKNWYLFFQSGNSCIEANNGSIIFTTVAEIVNGCLAIIKY